MLLHEYAILIVEPEVGPFAAALESAIMDHLGAATMIARGSAQALEHCKRFRFAGAVVNVLDSKVAAKLPCRAIVYAKEAMSPKSIVEELSALLGD